MTIITSKANALIKQTKKLHQKKYRTKSYLIEGWHLVEEAERFGAEFAHVFVTEDNLARASHFPHLTIVSKEVLLDLAQSESPQGIVAEVLFGRLVMPDLAKGRYLILEDVQDPGNVGTLIRTADAAGFDGVIISDKTADIYNAKTLRSMQGSHFHLPISRGNLLAVVNEAQSVGIPVLATTLSTTSVSYKTLPNLPHFLLVMGNEGQGISENMAEQADYLVHIPMAGQAESLNVAVAGGIVMFALTP